MSSDETLMQDKSDASGKSKQEFIKIPYVIYNLDVLFIVFYWCCL